MRNTDIRILILEDLDEDIMLVEHELLKAGLKFSLKGVATRDDFLKELDDFMPDIILADYMLPSYDGLSALEEVRGRGSDTPFIFVSGTIGSDFAVESRRIGATDYVSKTRLSMLAPALKKALCLPEEGRIFQSPGEVPAWQKKKTTQAAKPTILIIDDDANLRKTVSDIMRVKGYEPISAGNGADGLDLVKKNDVDIALVDLGLPDMSGLEVLEKVKAERPMTQAIILTGNATIDSAIEATNRGAFSYLRKPFEMGELLVYCKRAIEKRQADKEITRQSEVLRRTNDELKLLYDISMGIGRTIEMDKLCSEVFETLARVEIFSVGRMGAIFLVEQDRVSLVFHKNLTGGNLDACRNVRKGDCLCGLAAESGEIVISRNSDCDARHSRSFPEMVPHGHVVVPLKFMNEVVGVMCLYTGCDADIPLNVFHVLLSIGNQFGVAIKNSKLYEEVKSSSLHDPLTGLANRRLLDVMLRKGFARAARFGTPLSIVMIDIDHFKKYNDTYGHMAGDKILTETARIIANKTREGDLAARYGGEEFLVVLYETELEGACAAAEALRKTVEADVGITISLGVAMYAGNLKKEEDLIALADEALYRAKQNGRNRVEMSL